MLLLTILKNNSNFYYPVSCLRSGLFESELQAGLCGRG